MYEGYQNEKPRSEKELEILGKIARLKSREIELEANRSRTSEIALRNVIAEIFKLEGELREFRRDKNNLAA